MALKVNKIMNTPVILGAFLRLDSEGFSHSASEITFHHIPGNLESLMY